MNLKNEEEDKELKQRRSRTVNVLITASSKATATVNTRHSTKSRRSRRKRTQHISCVSNASICSNGRVQHSSVNSSPKGAGHHEAPVDSAVHNLISSKRKRKLKKKAESDLPAELGAVEAKPKEGAVETNPESDEQEMMELANSLQTLASEKTDLERNLNELREENDRLIRNNEDLKDELKEMTDEALELTVEKQRLLSKVGSLKKKLLNRPK